MQDLKTIVQRAQAGEGEAFGLLIRRFQDMAVGYSYSILGDFALAEDAAQEAFLSAYRLISQLREAAAFPGWFRRIVFKQCDRLVRRRDLTTVAIDQAARLSSPTSDPALVFEQHEIRIQVRQAINKLPLPEREVVTLFYISQYSQKEIATFLELPLSTIKSRLHSARKRLKERIVTVIQENLPEQRPSRDERFTQNVAKLLQASADGDTAVVKRLLDQDRSLVQAVAPVQDRLWVGDTSALHWAVMHQQYEVIDLLLAQGADINQVQDGMTPLQDAIDLYLMPDYDYDGRMLDFLMERGADMDLFAALMLDKTDLVKQKIEANPDLVHARGPGNATPLCFANLELARFLIDRGADILANTEPDRNVSYYQLHNPIRWKARWPDIPGLRLLLEKAQIAVDPFLACVLNETETVISAVKSDPMLVQAQTNEPHVLGSGLMLLHLAVQYDRTTLVTFLLSQGADIHARSPGLDNLMPLHVAAWKGLAEMARMLVEYGADVNLVSGSDNLTPLAVARQVHSDEIDRTDVAGVLQELGAMANPGE